MLFVFQQRLLRDSIFETRGVSEGGIGGVFPYFVCSGKGLEGSRSILCSVLCGECGVGYQYSNKPFFRQFSPASHDHQLRGGVFRNDHLLVLENGAHSVSHKKVIHKNSKNYVRVALFLSPCTKQRPRPCWLEVTTTILPSRRRRHTQWG